MSNMIESGPYIDPSGLNRFTRAQEKVYYQVVKELRSSQKQGHWMWFIFPQMDGLGVTECTKYYAIKNLQEASEYLRDPVLGRRLIECTEIVLSIEGKRASEIFGYTDEMKLRSSMTLFELVDNSITLFTKVLEKYFNNERDHRTLLLIKKLNE